MTDQPPAEGPQAPKPGSKLLARLLLIGMGLLVLAYAAAMMIHP
jgi:hypothetical protein